MKSKKRHFIIGILVIVLAIFLMIFIGFKSKDYFTKYNYSEEDNFADSGLIHFGRMPITYSLDVNTAYGLSRGQGKNTDEYERERIRWAFSLLENYTEGILKFQEVGLNKTADIYIYGVPEFDCYDENESYSGIEGFAGPINYKDADRINQSIIVYCAPFYSIISGDDRGFSWDELDPENIGYSWKDGACEKFPVLEMHEILHALGFDHTYEDSEGLMYPIDFKIQSCQGDKLDEKTVSCLKNIYSNGKQGSCQNVDLYPWKEDPTKNIENFAWESLPVSYHVEDCNEVQISNLKKAEEILENRLGADIFNYSDSTFTDVSFKCMSPLSDINLNWETDFWTTSDYFPAAQPYYKFDENGSIKKVEILLFGQDRKCGGIELHEFLHAIGVRNHEGYWMHYEKEVCMYGGVIDTQSLDAVRDIYDL